jgi:hypothetical protein
MELPDKVIKYVLMSNSSADEKFNLLDKFSRARSRTLERQKKVERIQKESATKIAELLKEVICDHEITEYHGDPSGGSDSEEQCLICGVWVDEKRRKVRST